MAKTKISEFSSTPGNNTDIDSINIAEGCAPSGINDAIRELMAQLKDFQQGTAGDSFNGPVGTTTAAAGAFTTLSASGAVTLSGGTANGVAYLNGSKVLTTGSALTFDGTRLTSTVGKFGSGAAANSASLMVNNVTNTATGIQLFQDGIESWIMGMPANSAGLAWSASGSEQMRLTSTGLGIGTSSPNYSLTAYKAGATATYLQVANGATGAGAGNGLLLGVDASGNGVINAQGAVNLNITVAGVQRATLDSSGNLGLGVTPSAWISAFKAMEFAAAGSVSAISDELTVGANAVYLTGTNWTYKATGFASQYRQSNSAHKWFTAPSGTAGNAISFTQALTLTAAGELLVGTTSSAGYKFRVYDGPASFSQPTSSADCADFHNRGTTGDNKFLTFYTEASATTRGSITYNRGAGLVAYNVTSDYRAKDIIGPVTDSGALIDSVPVYMGKMKGATQERPMFIAHETPAYAHTGEKDAVDADGNPVYQQMDASALVPVLWAEVQSLRQRLAALESN